MQILNQVSSFIHSSEFWYYHGWVLTSLWVIGSALGVIAKRYNTLLHVLIFAIVDFTTLFFAGAALYQIYPTYHKFWEWSTIKQGHIAGGSIFLVLIIMQHLGGVMAFINHKRNPVHRSLGRPLATIGRIIAACGWIFVGNLNMATYVGIAACVILLSHVVFGEKPQKKAVQSAPKSRKRD